MGAVAVLAVSPAEEDHVFLARVFDRSSWKFDWARTCGEAIELLKGTEVPVVLCAMQLPDGSWRDLLAEFAGQPVPPRLIVASHLADESLWVDVLDRGGYDVLAMPFDPNEVLRVVSLAWRQWQQESERLARSASAAG
jgi:DNA-binding response OmpR family regulator